MQLGGAFPQMQMGPMGPMGPGPPGRGGMPGVQVQTQQLAQAVANLLVHSPELIQQLVDAGVPEAGTNPSAAINAVLQNPALLQLLMSHPLAQQHFWPLVPQAAMLAGPGVNLPGEPPLFQAAREGEISVVERLLGPLSGEELSRQVSPSGDSLLHVACWEGRDRLVSMLLARRHDVHALSRNRSTPLHYAAWNGHRETVTILLDTGEAELERHMQGGDTALHQAAWYRPPNNTPVTEILPRHQHC